MLRRQKLVVGNWKMFGSLAQNAGLLDAVLLGLPPAPVETAFCVPFPYLAQMKERCSGSALAWGAQDLSDREPGAYTGDVAAGMLADFGCRFVIVGHSERRAVHGESSELVARKAIRALSVDLTPIVCVGETLAEREADHTIQVIGAQLDAVLDALGSDGMARSVLAYEPVWAIGSGRTASPVQAEEVHDFLRKRVNARFRDVADGIRILYGGSVKPGNAKELFQMPDIDGGLVGGASLVAQDFLAIVNAGQE